MNIEESINLLEWANLNKLYIETYYECDYHNIYKAIETLLTAYEKEKEKNKLLEDNYSSAHEDINWFCENYISKKESEQKERKAYIKGTNDADELCNKKWEDKIKAKIEEVQNMKAKAKDIAFKSSLNYIETELQSLLEKK